MILGFVHHGPEQVFGRLVRTESSEHMHILRPGEVPPSSKKVRHLVIFDFADFEDNANVLRLMTYTIYVFSSAFDLGRWGIPAVDEDCDSILDVDFSKGGVVPRAPVGKGLTQQVLSIVQQYSLFGDLMSHIYDLPSRVAQKPATTACCKWLTSDEKDLDGLSQRLKAITKSKTHVHEGIMEVMARPIARRLQRALRDVTNGMDIEEASNRNQVRPFEIGFVFGSLDRKADATDIYVQNTGEE